MKKIKAFFIVFLLAFTALPASAAGFNPDNIISDTEMLDAGSMTLAEIDAFLKSKGGYIAYHKFPNYRGEMKSAAQIIYEAANNYDCDDTDLGPEAPRSEQARYCQPTGVNPKLLLVLLQKEQSLIEETDPAQGQLDWATGYGCPDGGGCNPRWQGFGKQVNSAGLQFYDYMMNPQNYSYRAGNNYRVTNTGRDDMIVHIQNNATAALYNYTPHVYNGNYNFYNLWQRYFTLAYPNNSLLQARGEPGVWLVQNGFRRPILSRGALASRFDMDKIIPVAKSDLERYPVGNPIKFSQYSFVRSPRGTVYLLVDDTRRGFVSGEALRQVGVHPEEIIDASWEDLNVYEEGRPITATTSYPMGALLQDKTTGGIYYVFEGTKAPLWDRVLLDTKFRGQVIIPESPEKLASYQTMEPAIFGDGELIKLANASGVYVIDNGARRGFVSGEIFEKLGYKWSNIITVPKRIFDLYPEGKPIAQVYSEEEEVEDIDTPAASTPDIATGTEIISTTSNPDLMEEVDSILNP